MHYPGRSRSFREEVQGISIQCVLTLMTAGGVIISTTLPMAALKEGVVVGIGVPTEIDAAFGKTEEWLLILITRALKGETRWTEEAERNGEDPQPGIPSWKNVGTPESKSIGLSP